MKRMKRDFFERCKGKRKEGAWLERIFREEGEMVAVLLRPHMGCTEKNRRESLARGTKRGAPPHQRRKRS